MKLCVPVLLVCAAAGYCQTPAATSPVWRSRLLTLPTTPPASTTPQDIAQFEHNMRMAAVYLGNTSPNGTAAQWEANRLLVRRMAAYLAGLHSLTGDAKLRSAVTHAQSSFDSLGFAPYLAFMMSANSPYQDVPQGDVSGVAGDPPLAPAPAAPPFELDAPELTNVGAADKTTAADLTKRYEEDSANASAVWQNAEMLRQNLAMRGMGLNLETATAMMRLPQQFHSAAADLRNSNWDSARSHLEQAEAVTEKIAKTVGR